jgi:hypothetical protein
MDIQTQKIYIITLPSATKPFIAQSNFLYSHHFYCHQNEEMMVRGSFSSFFMDIQAQKYIIQAI